MVFESSDGEAVSLKLTLDGNAQQQQHAPPKDCGLEVACPSSGGMATQSAAPLGTVAQQQSKTAPEEKAVVLGSIAHAMSVADAAPTAEIVNGKVVAMPKPAVAGAKGRVQAASLSTMISHQVPCFGAAA